ncbi:16S rRNA (cytidine(1402)-2'-O)-methyltransferase [Candidatus Kaiserbacteria bacterium CG10_big_fil_rev_8_21_14_0_10_47_16]|uniref:Ribosomal RNA small subunit methyltransferase I n=1 Tax=Candidatus Kaiserbacteria bacterium CG10_big_fil_rev_8_21_14_0_10_47_16 TaxID=1974608 RepID=A0A2H0UEP4_9BACT|nr:MAG: 16S rRNA (cytidine(1402)-2'-O)-methyltransferase [Candidatus Kaiserbacteria bacterium CG10_big_fil_rev_8_21_14_0_10_47_16]
MNGTLSIVATPIGNLEDITLRAIRVLGEAEYILCEDTRVTGKLLGHYAVSTKTKRYDAHTSEHAHEQILKDLADGKCIALISDAGTPGISDPGVLLIQRAREAGVVIEAIPGPSSVTAAFSIAGIVGNQFAFLGFIPQKKGRKTFFEELADYEIPVIFFESVHRIMKTLESLAEYTDDRTIVVCRELTKMHEEVVRGSAAEALQYFTENADHQRGEFVVIVGP